jgi:putative transcriptional regulator
MMEMQQGYFLKSMGLLQGTVFEDSLILIAEYNEKGALGFSVNKPFGRNLNELEEFKHSLAFPIYEGGPVDQEHLYFVHQRADVIEEGVLIADGLYLGGNFKQAVEAINNRTLTTADVKIFIGYNGWDAGDLEAEVEEGSWLVEARVKEEVFMNW